MTRRKIAVATIRKGLGRAVLAAVLLGLGVLGLGVLGLTACGRTPATGTEEASGGPDGSEPARTVVNDERFHEALRAAAASYETFGEVDDLMRWVPGLCRLPTMTIHPSASTDEATHGGKLFWMFAKQRDAYLNHAYADQPVGQVLVKEAWASRAATAEEIAGSSARALASKGIRPPEGARFDTLHTTTVQRDGGHFTADTRKGLYVMLKLAADTEGTDAGWVYGTLAPDGKTVSSAGRVESCMGCHEGAGRDRMFGLRRP
ncbi:MAG: cytochrome P460 family protein [Planctomycetota bacterium]|nr:cytochrome P460 family protein [Planctomycetota bacterium]